METVGPVSFLRQGFKAAGQSCCYNLQLADCVAIIRLHKEPSHRSWMDFFLNFWARHFTLAFKLKMHRIAFNSCSYRPLQCWDGMTPSNESIICQDLSHHANNILPNTTLHQRAYQYTDINWMCKNTGDMQLKHVVLFSFKMVCVEYYNSHHPYCALCIHPKIACKYMSLYIAIQSMHSSYISYQYKINKWRND